MEQKTVYFLMIPLTLEGGSQETNTTELEAAAAFTPAGGPGTESTKQNPTLSHTWNELVLFWLFFPLIQVQIIGMKTDVCSLKANLSTVFFGAGVNLFAADSVPCSGEGQHLDAVVGVFLQAIQLQRGFWRGHVPDFSQLWAAESEEIKMWWWKTFTNSMFLLIQTSKNIYWPLICGEQAHVSSSVLPEKAVWKAEHKGFWQTHQETVPVFSICSHQRLNFL